MRSERERGDRWRDKVMVAATYAHGNSFTCAVDAAARKLGGRARIMSKLSSVANVFASTNGAWAARRPATAVAGMREKEVKQAEIDEGIVMDYKNNKP